MFACKLGQNPGENHLRILADSLLEGTDMTAKVTAEDLLKLIREDV